MSRNYVSPQRESGAVQTRHRVLAAAAELIADRGYGRTTLRDIASAAGVSLQTVNLLGSKASVASEALAMTFMEDPDATRLTESDSFVQIMANPDTTATLRAYFRVLAAANARSCRLARAMKAAADVDDAVRAQVEEGEQHRRDDMRRAALWMLSRGLISAEDVQRTADVQALVTSVETCVHLVVDCGWSTADYADWMLEAFIALALRRRSLTHDA